ncbi:MAG: IS200/IS605 family transposase [Promethearchaeota archaeon]
MHYQHSRHAVFLINYHFIFVPKYRKKILVGCIKQRLTDFIQTYPEEKDLQVLALEIMPDQVHLFLSTPPSISPSQIVHGIKGRTSRLLRQEFPFLKRHKAFWSRSYFVGSSGNVSSENIKKYIEESQHL